VQTANRPKSRSKDGGAVGGQCGRMQVNFSLRKLIPYQPSIRRAIMLVTNGQRMGCSRARRDR